MRSSGSAKALFAVTFGVSATASDGAGAESVNEHSASSGQESQPFGWPSSGQHGMPSAIPGMSSPNIASPATAAWCDLAIAGAANGADNSPAATVTAMSQLRSRLGFMERIFPYKR